MRGDICRAIRATYPNIKPLGRAWRLDLATGKEREYKLYTRAALKSFRQIVREAEQSPGRYQWRMVSYVAKPLRSIDLATDEPPPPTDRQF